jgi:DNA polymerase-4
MADSLGKIHERGRFPVAGASPLVRPWSGGDRERIVLHVDMDAFFAAVEIAQNPALRGKPVIVCGDPNGRSVVTTASYEARRFGVHSAMPIREARRLCPDGIYVTGSPGKYIEASLQILEIFKRFTPAVEPFSIDEAFLELTHVPLPSGIPEEERPVEAARRIKAAVHAETGLTASIGIAPNKLQAKMASGLEKPDGLTRFRPGDFTRIFGPKPVEELWGVGPQSGKALRRVGIGTIDELARADPRKMEWIFGVNGPRLVEMAEGKDGSAVVPYYERVDAKSVGHEHTLDEDLSDGPALRRILLWLVEKVARRLRHENYRGRCITVKLRFSDFTTITRQRALGRYTDDERTIGTVARELFEANHGGRAIRLLGVSVSEIVHNVEQGSLFPEEDRYRKLLTALDAVRSRFGEHAIGSLGADPEG